MAWLQNLAGKAENLLNKIDQNAANVLNDPNSKQQTSLEMEEDSQVPPSETTEEKEQGAVALSSNTSDSQFPTVYEGSFIGDDSSSSVHNSDEYQRLDTKINQLEHQNQQYAREIMSLQHLYSEVKNENAVLGEQLQRANESVAATVEEMEQYKIRAQRVLQEKEKLISYKENVGSGDTQCDSAILANYLEETKKELSFQQEKNEELSIKLQNVSLELSAMQQQFFEASKIHEETTRKLEEAFARERKLYLDTEDELKEKTKEMQTLVMQLTEKTQVLKTKEEELEQVKMQLKQSTIHTSNKDLEARMHSLTETLMTKQSTLETVTTERNALRLQLEKLEYEYHKLMSKIPQHTTVQIETVNDTDDVSAKSQVPQFMRVSPLDAGVTKRVKRAYSTLDAISVRAGVFLRRYPLARVFVFCYCVLLHFWVIIILFNYIPSVR